jgi:hypothetical protein
MHTGTQAHRHTHISIQTYDIPSAKENTSTNAYKKSSENIKSYIYLGDMPGGALCPHAHVERTRGGLCTRGLVVVNIAILHLYIVKYAIYTTTNPRVQSPPLVRSTWAWGHNAPPGISPRYIYDFMFSELFLYAFVLVFSFALGIS